MKAIAISQLKPVPQFPVTLLHRSGIPVLEAGEALPDTVVALLRESGEESLHALERNESVDGARRQLMQTSMAVADLNPGEKIGRAVYDEGGRLLLDADAAVPAKFAESLSRRSIDTIYVNRNPSELEPDKGRALREAVRKLLRPSADEYDGEDVVAEETREELEQVELVEADQEDFTPELFEQKLNRLTRIEVAPSGEAFEEQVKKTHRNGMAGDAEKKALSDVAGDSVALLKSFFGTLGRGRARLPIDPVEKVAVLALGGMIRNRDLLVLCGTSQKDEDYLVNHSLALTVLSVNIGTTLGYSVEQIKALAYGAMLADSGMLKIPREIRDKSEQLTPRERAEINRHPAYGLDMLQRIERLPREVPYIVYQTHERVNGSGYPCGKTGVVIHSFARIVGVADSYAAMCVNRPYRRARAPYQAMEQVVRMCGSRQLDGKVVRAFLQCQALTPVGSYVVLADDRVARVVSANPEDYTRPVVTALLDGDHNKLPEPERINLLEEQDISIVRALDAAEEPLLDDALAGF